MIPYTIYCSYADNNGFAYKKNHASLSEARKEAKRIKEAGYEIIRIDNNRSILYNGVKTSDAKIAKVMVESIKVWKGNIQGNIAKMIQWLISHCKNVHSLNVECVLEAAYYDEIGVFTTGIQKEISRQVSEKVEQLRIADWD